MLHPSLSDHELAARAAAGDPAAFEILAERHWEALVRFARGRLSGGFEHFAEDAVQEAAIKAMRALRKGTVPPEPRAWLFVIVRNCCADLRRGSHGEAELSEHAAAPADVHEAVASSDRLGRVVHAIDQLPAGQRKMIIGREFEGRTYEQLATAHATTVGAVKSALVRARRNLAAAPGVYGLAAPFAWLSRRLGPVLSGREAGADVAIVGAGAQGAALAAVAATAVTLVPFAPPERDRPSARPEGRAVTVTEQRLADARAERSAPGASRAGTPAGGAASVPTVHSLLAACAAGRPIDEDIPRSVARRALRELPADLAEYTTCRADLRRAELDALGG